MFPLKAINKNGPLFLIGGSVLILFLVAAVYFVQMRPSADAICPKAEAARFDFTEFDFSAHKSAPLCGNVSFYWDALYVPRDFEDDGLSYGAISVEIPSSWNGLEYKGQRLGAFGYGTYHFGIEVSEPGMYCLKVKEFETAFRLWINGEPVGGAGKVGVNKETSIPSWERQEFEFYTADINIDFVLQVSNFHHRKGGVGELMVFGRADAIRNIKVIRASTEALLLGVLLILFLFNITFYHYQRKDVSLLYFSMAVLFIFLRLSTTGEKLLVELLPFLPWSITTRIEYLALVGIAPFLTAFFKSMLPEHIPAWLLRTLVVIYSTFALAIIVLPAFLFTYITTFNIAISFVFIIIIFVFLFKAAVQRAENGVALFGSYVFLSLIMINDLLLYVQVIQSVFLLPFGLIILLVTQAFVLSRNTSKAYLKVDLLSQELEKYTLELEDLVAKRTEKLQEQNSRIELQKSKIENQAYELEKSNKRLLKLDNFRRDMTHMMVHDLKNPLTNVIGFLQLPTIDEKRKQVMLASSIQLQNLIVNILDVTKYQNVELSAHHERFVLSELVDAAYAQNEFAISTKYITFQNNIPKRLSVFVDGSLITRVLSNIIFNATKYKNTNGVITVDVEEVEEDGRLYDKVIIYNSGEAIPEDKIDGIFDIYSQVYESRGEYSYSTGIGLAFCKIAIEAHMGQIGAVSYQPKGVSFWFTLPCPA